MPTKEKNPACQTAEDPQKMPAAPAKGPEMYFEVPVGEGKLIAQGYSDGTGTDWTGVTIGFVPYANAESKPAKLVALGDTTMEADGIFGLEATLYDCGEQEPVMVPHHFRLTPTEEYIFALFDMAVRGKKARLCVSNEQVCIGIMDVHGVEFLIPVPWLTIQGVQGVEDNETLINAVFRALCGDMKQSAEPGEVSLDTIWWILSATMGRDIAPF